MIEIFTLQGMINFFVTYVILRQIVAPFLAKHIMHYLTQHNTRNLAIFKHYEQRVTGTGHYSEDVRDCSEGECNVFKRGLTTV